LAGSPLSARSREITLITLPSTAAAPSLKAMEATAAAVCGWSGARLGARGRVGLAVSVGFVGRFDARALMI